MKEFALRKLGLTLVRYIGLLQGVTLGFKDVRIGTL